MFMAEARSYEAGMKASRAPMQMMLSHGLHSGQAGSTSGQDACAIPKQVSSSFRLNVLPIQGAHDAVQLLRVAPQKSSDLQALLKPAEVWSAA